MDFLLAALGDRLGDLRLGGPLLNLDLDIVVVDTTSTYCEVDVADDRPTCSPNPRSTTAPASRPSTGRAGSASTPSAATTAPRWSSRLAVTRDGIPVRCWTFPGSESDQWILRTVRDDPGSWNLHRLVWVADAGFAPPPTAPTSPAVAGTTYTPRSCATPPPRPPRRWPAPAATTTSPTTFGSRTCGSHRVAGARAGAGRS